MSFIETSLAKMKAQRTEAKQERVAPPRDLGSGPAVDRRRDVSVAAALDLTKLSLRHIDADGLAEMRVLPQTGNAPSLQAYKMLRTRVVQRMRANGWRTLAISSLQPGEGKSLTALNLALSIARDRSFRSILVELDLLRPVLSRYLQLESVEGVEEYLQGSKTMDQVVYATSVPGLFVAPASRHVENSSELLGSQRARDLVGSIAALDDNTFCIFDLPPLLQTDDLLAFAPLVDAVLLVVAEGQTDRQDLVRAQEVLGDLNLLGVVLNKSRERADPYGY